MDIIKEYCKEANKCVIRTSTYAKSLAHINKLYNEALEDFPDLKQENIEVILYAGRCHARQYGIEFVPTTEPTKYKEISELENTY